MIKAIIIVDDLIHLKQMLRIFLHLTVIIFISFGNTFAQLPDSVKVALNKAAHDTSRITILLDYADKVQDSSVLVYTGEALKIIIKHNDSPFKKIMEGYKSDIETAEGNYYRNIAGDFEAAGKKFNKALAIAESINDKSRQAHALAPLQEMAIMSGDLENGKMLNDRCIKLQEETNDKEGLAVSLISRANFFSMKGQIDSSLACYKKMNEIAESLKDTILISAALDGIGIAHLNRGDIHLAMPDFFKSIRICEQAGKENEAYAPMMHAGGGYAKLGEYEKAIVFYKRALPIVEKAQDFGYICDLNLNMGIAYRFLHQNDSAIICQKKALDASHKIGIKMYSIYANVNLGLNYLDKKDTLTALNYFRKSLEENTDSLPGGLFESYFQIGDVWLKQNKIDSAFYYANLMKRYTARAQNMETKKAAMRLLSDVHERKGNYSESLKHYKDYIFYRDSIDNKKSFRIAIEKQYEYEAEKQELIAKAEREKKDIQIKEQKNKRIISTVAFAAILALGGSLVFVNRKRKENMFRKNLAESEMKALRAQMNPHFMFNSLNAIQQMVLNNENDNAFHYLDTYSKLTRKILENSEKKWITVDDEIKFLELYLSIESLRFQHSFKYEIKVDDDVSVHSDKVPAVVVQPYVENAIKHGLLPKENNQQLLIRFNRVDEDSLEIIVEDNGVGRKRSHELKPDSNHQSMGMTITENRLKLLEGKKGNRVFIEDLVSADGSAAGTCVHIMISQAE